MSEQYEGPAAVKVEETRSNNDMELSTKENQANNNQTITDNQLNWETRR